MRKYLKYKDSEVQWIGEIPENWAVRRINSLFKQRSETVSDKDFSPLSVTKNGILPQIEGVAKTENNDARKLVRKGDFVINSRSDRKGSSGTSRYDGSVSVINIVLEPHSIDPLYAEFLLKSNEFVEEYFRNGKGIVWDLWSTRYSEMKYILIPSPPLPEQQQIVTYLDHKTTLIDQIISGSEKKIELLKEQRTATINHAVTKGLNPKVKMKDSGVEWIGEIPEGWEIRKMKYCLRLVSEKGSTSKEDIKISPENVENETGVCFNFHSEYEGEGMRFQSGDILLNKLRIYLKKIILTTFEGFSMGEMIVLRTIDGFNKYYHYTLFNQGLIDLLNEQSTGVKLPRVSPDIILNTNIIYPPVSEQQQIVNHLDQKTKEIDDLIASEKKRIELLKEYRHSLISEVVTGKIKVTKHL
jgi:type I restriction enzyme S subunit